jgi:hypothetical protein
MVRRFVLRCRSALLRMSHRAWLCPQVNKVCLSVKKAVGRKAKEGQKKGGKGALQVGDELGYDDFEDVGGDDDY